MREFLKEAKARGLIYQCTNEEKIVQIKNPIAYIGFDLTSDSLHIGSLIPIMLARLFQRHGGKLLVVIGDATTRIGDPSGKDKTRTLLNNSTIDINKKNIQSDLSKFLQYAKFLNNDLWLKDLLYTEFLRDIGTHFSVNKMLHIDSVQSRLSRKQPLSFLEFNYMLIQAYDFLHLFRQFGCAIQLGGSDQWGNIVSGIELIRRITRKETYGITTPLLTNNAGKKMGKTEHGAIWLNSEKLSPYEYYQYWRNVDDSHVVRFLNLFTEIPIPEIQKLEILKGSDINIAKEKLAFSCTALCHGHQEALKSQDTAKNTFSNKNNHELRIGENLPKVNIQKDIGLLEAMCLLGLAKSNSEARRSVLAQSVRINNQIITDPRHVITRSSFINGVLKISSSKKKHGILQRII